MFKIMKETTVIAVVGKPTYVRMQENGSFGLTSEDSANGVAVNGAVYHLIGRPEITGAESVVVVEEDDGQYAGNLTALVVDPTDLKNAEQFRKAVQLFAGSLDEEAAQVVATIYDPYEVGKDYKMGDYLTYGVNSVGDPQLYKVIQPHTSHESWTPDEANSLFVAIGLNDQGYPVWSQPTGSHDAYNTGDIMDYNGTLYRSTVDGNVWSPESYPAGWEVYTEE